MNNIQDIMGKLSPTTRNRLTTALGKEAERQPTPSIGLNLALKGGLGFGRQVLLWGNKSAGKSALLQTLVGQAQKQGRTCAWIDAENSWSDEWATRLGADGNELILSEARSVNAATEDIKELMAAGTDIIIVDSISALVPGAFFSDKGELKEVDDSKQIGSASRDLGVAIKQWNLMNQNSLLILISQVRNSFGSMHASHIPDGGHAAKFFSSTVIKLWSSEAEANAIKGSVASGDRFYDEKIGRPVNWIVEYNKLGPQNRGGQYDFYYDGDFVGIDHVGEVLDYAEKYGIVEKGGAWYKVYGEPLQGRAKAVAYLRENAEIVEKLEGELLAKV